MPSFPSLKKSQGSDLTLLGTMTQGEGLVPNTAVIGFDLGLTNMAAVIYNHKNPTILHSTTEGPGGSDLQLTLRYFQNRVIPKFTDYPGSYVVIDWSKSESYMRTNRIMTTYKSFITGYLYRALLSQGSFPIILSPQSLRKVMSLGQNVKKEVVWKRFKLCWKGDSIVNTFNEHEYDSLILGWAFTILYPFRGNKTLWP